MHLWAWMDVQKGTRWRRFQRFLRRRYRLVILNDTTFGEKFSLRLSPYGLLIGALATTIIMTTLVISLIAFTPLREYIPGYGDVTERKQLLRVSLRADSLQQAIETRDLYLTSVFNALTEKVETKGSKPKRDTTGKYTKINIKASEADLEFRQDYEQGRNSSSVARLIYAGLNETVFFAPVKGLVSTAYSIQQEHYGIDIVTREDETIKTTLNGTIIFTGFTSQDGNIIQVQHTNNLISIYKHCSSLLKSRGDRVKSGEAIAVVGNSGERSNGPHLHFELWYNGSPVNPQEFISF